MKYRGVINGRKLKFDGELNNFFQRIACGIEILNILTKSLPEETKILLHNAIAEKSSTSFRFNFDTVAEVITHNYRKKLIV